MSHRHEVYRKAALQAGKCRYCGKGEVEENKTGCEVCLDKEAARQQRVRDRKKAPVPVAPPPTGTIWERMGCAFNFGESA
jgi:hypothetical protein